MLGWIYSTLFLLESLWVYLIFRLFEKINFECFQIEIK